MKPELLSHDSVTDRDLYFLSLPDLKKFPESISLGSEHFAVFIAAYATHLDVDSISTMAQRLIRSGAAYVCCYGPGCERVHDIFDEIQISEKTTDDDSVIMTTWHDNDTLLDALWFFAANSLPDEKYFDTCKAGLAISIGNPEWDAQIIDGLKEPEDLFRKTDV